MTQRRPVVSWRRAEGLLAADQQKRASDSVRLTGRAAPSPPRALCVTRRKRSKGASRRRQHESLAQCME